MSDLMPHSRDAVDAPTNSGPHVCVLKDGFCAVCRRKHFYEVIVQMAEARGWNIHQAAAYAGEIRGLTANLATISESAEITPEALETLMPLPKNNVLPFRPVVRRFGGGW